VLHASKIFPILNKNTKKLFCCTISTRKAIQHQLLQELQHIGRSRVTSGAAQTTEANYNSKKPTLEEVTGDLRQQEAHTGGSDTKPIALLGQSQNKSWVQALCQEKPTLQQRQCLGQATGKHCWKG